MAFKTIYYVTIACPTIQKTLEMTDKYVAHGVQTLQIDMPSKNPFAETEFVKKMMKESIAKEPDYRAYMDAVREIHRKHPALELHLMSYPDIVDSVGKEAYAEFAQEVGVVSLMLCGPMPEERAYFNSRGLFGSGHVEFDLPDEQVSQVCDPDRHYTLVTMRNAREGQTAKPGYETWAARVGYLKEKNCPYPLYGVGGFLNGEMLREAKDAGVVGAYIGNVLMWNWENEDKLWALLNAFETVARA